MKRYKVEWEHKARREIQKIDQRYRQAISKKVKQLANFPDVQLDIKHLDGSEYRLRHGDYRIFFKVINGIPKIIKIQRIKRRNSRTYN